MLPYFAFLNSSAQQPPELDSTALRHRPMFGNQACAACHASIYESYTRPPWPHAADPQSKSQTCRLRRMPNPAGSSYRIYTEGEKVLAEFSSAPAIQNIKRQAAI